MSNPVTALTLLDGGPPLTLQRRLGLIKPNRPRLVLRTLLAVGIGWLPLMLFGFWSGCFDDRHQPCAPWMDFSVHARSLVAVSMLILAEGICTPRLGAIAYQFYTGDLVQPKDEERYLAAVDSTLRLRGSMLADVIVIILAYALIASLEFSPLMVELPAWHLVQTANGYHHSPAGWWHGLVSLPILLALLLGWLWRVLLWARFLWLMSKLDLQLSPVHPDLTGGLKFVGYSARAYTPFGFALGAIVAGSIANQVVYTDVEPLSFKFVALGLVITVLLLCEAPLLVFGDKLLKTWQRGVFEYGALASRVGRRLEKKWIGKLDCDDALDAPDFSATTDLYQIVGNVYAMRLWPFDLASTIGLVAATAAPFLPVPLLTIPFYEIIEVATKLLF